MKEQQWTVKNRLVEVTASEGKDLGSFPALLRPLKLKVYWPNLFPILIKITYEKNLSKLRKDALRHLEETISTLTCPTCEISFPTFGEKVLKWCAKAEQICQAQNSVDEDSIPILLQEEVSKGYTETEQPCEGENHVYKNTKYFEVLHKIIKDDLRNYKKRCPSCKQLFSIEF